MPDVSVVTTVHGRLDHLRHLRRGLSRQDLDVEHVVVRMGGPDPRGVQDEVDVPVVPVEVPVVVGDDGTPWLPLAAARNAGAAAASAPLLVFLDVDCIPSSDLLRRYVDAADRRRGLLSGPVTYLPEGFDPTGQDDDVLRAAADPHPARPTPPDGQLVDEQRYELFWSLSFAVRPKEFRDLGGFCEDYVGYGGEDTDLGFTARRLGLPLTWVGGAVAWHQHHPTQDPPRQHLAAVVRNATVFRRRWGVWPMTGWLSAFAAEGLVDWDPDGDHLRAASG